MSTSIDRVSQLQDHADALAHAMFDALRLLPAAPAGGASEEHRAEVRRLAQGVLDEAKNVDRLIDALPGAADQPEAQLAAIDALAAESRAAAGELLAAHEEAVALAGSLREVVAEVSGGRLALLSSCGSGSASGPSGSGSGDDAEPMEL